MRLLLPSAIVWMGLACAADQVSAGHALPHMANPFAFLSEDYFARFSHDPEAVAEPHETAVESDWRIAVSSDSDGLGMTMATDLKTFLKNCMNLDLPVQVDSDPPSILRRAIVLRPQGGGEDSIAGSFTLRVERDAVLVLGYDSAGLRDGVVHLVDLMGFRAAPILPRGETRLSPRLGVRVGTVPRGGSHRDLVFMGYNGVMVSPKDGATSTQFHALSSSRAIPELTHLQDPGMVKRLADRAREARRYGLKSFLALEMWDFYPADAPIFVNHPELKGAEAYFHTDRPPAGHLLCTESPLMQQYLAETVRTIFSSIPVDGALIIVGGEVFQHCFMRPTGVEKGHTNCPRCEKLGAEAVVSNLCNRMAQAARDVSPEAAIVAWPYSAHYFWSADPDQIGFIKGLRPGTALLTEIEKDEVLRKEGGVEKAIWDYSIDLIGPTARAKRQIAACKAAGAAVYLKSEPELAFEAPGLPHIPCLDRWYDRAEALANSGADGAWVIAWFVPNLGTTSAEAYKYAWWSPTSTRDEVLARLAMRITGSETAATHLRIAWRRVSEAIPWSPELPPYFQGPYYLGPAHPMFADPKAEVPELFRGRSEFATFFLREARGDVEVFGRYYRAMEKALKEAVEEIDKAAPTVAPRCEPVFRAEELPTRWFYHTARTHANFYESCRLRDELTADSPQSLTASPASVDVEQKLLRWRDVLRDERENTRAALDVVAQDPRLDFHNTSSGAALAPAADLMHAKLEMLDHELNVYLPEIAARRGARLPK